MSDELKKNKCDFVFSFSKLKSWMRCEREFYHKYVIRDIGHTPTESMALGSLLDAIMTKGYVTNPLDKPSAVQLQRALESKYSDGAEATNLLLVKSGMFTAKARRVVEAGLRLRSDPTVVELLQGAEFQKEVAGDFCGVPFTGTIDIVSKYRGGTIIIDVKKSSGLYDAWTVDGNGRSICLPWYDAYDYWMQLTLYHHLYGDDTARCGLLSASDEEPPRIEYVGILPMLDELEGVWETPIRMMQSRFEQGWDLDNLSSCGKCEACRIDSKIVIPDVDITPRNRFSVAY